jgi:nitroreductase
VDFWQVIEARHSVRAFDPDAEVSPEIVKQLLEAATRSPSAGNRQPWHFYVVRDAVVRQGLASAAYGQDFVAEAPVVIVVCAVPEQSATRYGARGRELYCLQDTAVAAEHILLAAVELGLGGCWVGAFDERQAAHLLNLPTRHRPVALLPLGKPAGTSSEPAGRRALEIVATYVG